MKKPLVCTGIDQLLLSNFDCLHGSKVGVVTNATGVFQDMKHLVDVLNNVKELKLVAIFGPEHGFRGAAQAGSSEDFTLDAKTGLPIYDIYMKSSHQLSTLFEKVDMNILLFDIQDVGARFYTLIWTLYDCMVAVAMASKHIKMLVTDRPNPVGGAIIDGPLLNDSFSSFVGRKAILLRHGMTIGEIAQLFNAEFVTVDAGKQVELEVLCMKGWERTMIFSETGLLWVPPSPNMPSLTTAAFYLGTALFEGTNCSEGRGTTLPFEMIGAPWLDYHLISDLQKEDCPGALFREAWFIPSFSKFSWKLISGIQVHLRDVAKFNSLRTALTILASIIKLYPHYFEWHKDGNSYWIDKLVGNSSLREDLSRGASADEVIATWQDDILWFGAMRQKYLLY